MFLHYFNYHNRFNFYIDANSQNEIKCELDVSNIIYNKR